MLLRFLCLSFLVMVARLGPILAQTPLSDPQAVTVLTQSLNVAGGMQGLSSIQDFVATGTITYFWAGEEVSGPATVRARGFDQFRLDVNLPTGTRSWMVNRGARSVYIRWPEPPHFGDAR